LKFLFCLFIGLMSISARTLLRYKCMQCLVAGGFVSRQSTGPYRHVHASLAGGMWALSYSLAHLAVLYGSRQDACLEPKYIQ
jgi:hypothetical protein